VLFLSVHEKICLEGGEALRINTLLMKFSTSPHTRAQTPCTFARAPPLATTLGLGRGVTPPRSQCLLLGVATPWCHICRPFLLVFVGLVQVLVSTLQHIAAPDAAGIAFQTSWSCAPPVARIARPPAPHKVFFECWAAPVCMIDARPDLRPGGVFGD
jgi:hypothetical protein